MKEFRVGDLSTIAGIRLAIRDLEIALSQITDLAASTELVAPATPQVLTRIADGSYETWDLVSTSGCTIVKNAALKRFQISVP